MIKTFKQEDIIPIRDIENIKDSIILGDSLEILPQIPDESIDLILTDPPYNVSKKDKITRPKGEKGNDISLDFGDWDYGSVLPVHYIDDFARILKPNGVLAMFYDRLYLGIIGLYLQQKHGFKVRHIAAWIKPNAAPQMRKTKWKVASEMFLIATKNTDSKHHYNYKLGQSNDWKIQSSTYKHYHPTQKPLPIFNWIMSYWSFPGDIVLDPFLGAGTTVLSAITLGRHFIGIEKEEEYFNISVERATHWLSQQSLGLKQTKRREK